MGDLVERLRKRSDPAEWERILTLWDGWRKAIAEGDRSSWPRDGFESVLDGFAQEAAEAADALKAAEREREQWERDTQHARIRQIEVEAEATVLHVALTEARDVMTKLTRISRSVTTDLCSAHDARRHDASQSMREDDTDLRHDFHNTAKAARTWLSQHGGGDE